MNRHLLLLVPCSLLASCVSQSKLYAERLSAWDDQALRSSQEQASLELDLTASSSLNALLGHARQNNPGLRAAFERWKASLEKIPQATALPNPRLTLSSYLSEIETRVGPIRGSLGLAQPFPWFGKRQLSGDVAFETSEAAREMLESRRLELDQGVRDAWYEYTWVQRAILITEGNRDLLLHSESVATARMATGLSSHADVIRAQVELGKLEDRVQTLRDLRRPLIASLNAALNRDVAAELPIPSDFPLTRPLFDDAELSKGLALSSPLLRAMQHRVEGAEFSIDLAGKAFYPDFFLGLDYSLVGSARGSGVSGSGDDVLALKLGFDLPIWRSKYRSGVRSKEAMARAARLEREATLNRLRAELEMVLYQYRDANRRVELFSASLIPKGEESIRALDTAYQSGDGGFLDLIDAQRALLEFQLQVARASADRAQALAKVERITGVYLNLEQVQ